MNAPLLEVDRVSLWLPGPAGPLRILREVSFTLQAGEVLGIAGESGSGKSMTAACITGLLPRGARLSGAVRFQGRDLTRLRRNELRQVRGRRIGMIFQDPMSALHPMLTIGHQVTEHMRLHLKMTRQEARVRARELLERTRIPAPEAALDRYPHQFSGGMRQRAAIAIGLACDPHVVIADEPTTALDVTVQAGILQLLSDLSRERDRAVLLITHDLGVIASLTDRLLIFYAGRIVETGPTKDVLTSPRHPYTEGLLASLPQSGEGQTLATIEGGPPEPGAWPPGCPFEPRCAYRQDSCTQYVPELLPLSTDRSSACPVDPIAGTKAER